MDKWTFGISLTIVGMGGTLLTLCFLSLVTLALKKFFPPPEQGAASKDAARQGGAK